jgi:hypothetical protein
MALPKEPRQKMINLMYLVLTALLALNVSAEILNAFKTVDRSLTNTNQTINESTETIVSSLPGRQGRKTKLPRKKPKNGILKPRRGCPYQGHEPVYPEPENGDPESCRFRSCQKEWTLL